jgi:protein-S-isoprenylcysteine O-methyltransferase Ste14
MLTGVYQSITTLVTIVAFYIMDFVFMRRYDHERQTGKGWAWDYTLLTIAIGIVVIIQPLLFPFMGWHTASLIGLALQILGLVIIAASFGLHIWARIHLQNFYVERVEVQPGHLVVDTGPYAMVRHPIITSFFAFVIGLFLINPAITTLLVIVYTFWDFGRSARQEEILLSKSLPAYSAYMERTPRFLPHLWRRK